MSEELKRTLEELEIYKTELEAQNEELREKEVALRKSVIENEILFYDAPIAYIILDKAFEIVKYNREASKIFNLDLSILHRKKSFLFFLSKNTHKFLDWISMEKFVDNPIILPLIVGTKHENFKILGNKYVLDEDFLMLSLISIQKEIDLFEDSKRKDFLLESQSKMALLGEMINNISHQWRQPLSTMTVAASGIKLEKEMNILTDKELDEFLGVILNNSQSLSQTIDDFRNFTLNTHEYENFDIRLTIEKIINIFHSKLENKNIDVICDIDEQFYHGSESQLMQVFINIISNCFDQFDTMENIKKLIYVKMIKEKDKVIIEISDNAGGVKENIIDKIFQPYFTTKHKSIGTGIGLYMSMKIVKEEFQGDLICINKIIDKNENDKIGATFIITLPLFA